MPWRFSAPFWDLYIIPTFTICFLPHSNTFGPATAYSYNPFFRLFCKDHGSFQAFGCNLHMSPVSKDAVLTMYYTCHAYIRHACSFFTPNFYNNAQSPFVQSIILYQRRSAIRCAPADMAISISPPVVVIIMNCVFQ